jgi:hypothetical protein
VSSYSATRLNENTNGLLKVADQLRFSSQNFVQAYRKLQPVLKPSAHARTCCCTGSCSRAAKPTQAAPIAVPTTPRRKLKVPRARLKSAT